jgi:hypothetical protein
MGKKLAVVASVLISAHLQEVVNRPLPTGDVVTMQEASTLAAVVVVVTIAAAEEALLLVVAEEMVTLHLTPQDPRSLLMTRNYLLFSHHNKLWSIHSTIRYVNL